MVEVERCVPSTGTFIALSLHNAYTLCALVSRVEASVKTPATTSYYTQTHREREDEDKHHEPSYCCHYLRDLC